MLFSPSELWPLFASVLTSLVPIYVLFGLGFALRAKGFIPISVWDGSDKIVFWVLFPVFLFHRTVHADFSGAGIDGIIAALGGTILVMALGARLFKRLYRLDERGYVALYQAAFRLNIYVAIAVSEALFGTEGVAIAALATAITAPLMNAVALIELIGLKSKSEPGTSTKRDWLATIGRFSRGVALNPLVIACAFGAFANIVNFAPIGPIEETLSIAASAALPLALLGVGAGLRLEAIIKALRPVGIACTLKLIIAPSIALAGVIFFDVPKVPAFICVLFAAMPTSASAYQMTKSLGGDARLMAALITSQTLLTPLTAPILLAFAGVILGISLF